MKQSKVLVTGGEGFIASHLVDKLISLNFNVVVIDNESSECNDQFYKNSSATYYRYDISDYDKIRHLFNDVDFVFHMAAETKIQIALQNPLLCFKTNILGTSTILQCSKEANVKAVIYSSTSSAYGLKNSPPHNESMPIDCLNPYSVSKVSGEEICKMYTKLYGLHTVILRYFNVYGPRQSTKGPYASVLGIFSRQLNQKTSLTVVGDGEQKRDFVHVDDVVNANLLSMKFYEKCSGEIFNVGSGISTSIIDIARMISDNITYLDPREGEAFLTQANIQKIKNMMNWSPTKTIESYIKENK